MAGVFTALYVIFILNKKPSNWPGALYLSLLVENFHMLLVFVTRWNYPEKAYQVTAACAIPMIVVTLIASMSSIFVININDKTKLYSRHKPPKLAAFLRGLLATSLIVTFFGVSLTSYILLKNDSKDRTQRTLQVACDDVESNVNSTIENKLVEYITQAGRTVDQNLIDGDTPQQIIDNLLTTTKFTEINFINKQNVISYSNDPECIGLDMTLDPQTQEFTFLVTATDAFYIQEFQPKAIDVFSYMRYCAITVISNDFDIAYLQCGFDAFAYTQLVDSTISHSTKFTHIMQKGFVCVADYDGNIVSDLYQNTTIVPYFEINSYEVNNVYSITLKDKSDNTIKYYFMMKYTDGYYILAFANYNEMTLDLNVSFNALTFAQITLYLMLYFAMMLILKVTVVDKISRVSKALNQITDGDLNVHVNETQSYELKQLSDDINQTVETLERHAKEEAEKIEKELQFAKQIQLSALPCSFPAYPNISQFDLFAMMDTAKEVGGDFYDFYLVDDDHIAIQIADVSGKGVPAAMFMMKAKTVIKSFVGSGMPIDKAYIEANEKLCEGNDAQMFVTAWLGVVDIKTGHVEFVNAGHNPPLVRHKNGEFEYLKSKRGFVLAALEGYNYVKEEFTIEPGDQIFLYTDGVTEATNHDLVLYGEPKLKDVLNANKELDPTSLCEAIKASIDEFVDGAEQSDDITMLAFQYNGDMNSQTIEVDALTPNITKVTEFVEKFLEEKEAPSAFIMKINVIIDEIFSNIARYGFPDGVASKVRVTASINEDNQFVLVFVDNGIPYNPLAKEDPDITLSAEDRPIGGLGIFIVKKIMDEMLYERNNNRNILSLKKNLK